VTRTEYGKLLEPQNVRDHLILYGVATEGVTVYAGGSLDLYGTVVGALVVQEGASARVYGTVIGDVRNEGGKVAVWGTVGRLIRSAGETSVDPQAVIKAPA
jgi:hypothetical protein